MSDLSTNDDDRSRWSLAVGLAASLLAVYACFHQSRDWNTATRLLLTYSLVQNGSIEITPFVSRDGALLRDPPTRDLSSPGDGRYFCDKAPGHSFLGVPVYWMTLKLGLVDPYPDGVAARAYWPNDYWTTLGTNGVAVAAAAVLLFSLLTRSGVRTDRALFTAQVWGLGTIAFPYATLYYGHATCAFFTLASVYLLARWPARRSAALLAGTAGGIAVTIDYPQAVFVVLAVATLFVWGIGKPNRPFLKWSWLYFVVGGLPLAILLGWYHAQVTGSPLRVPYTMEVEEMFAYHREGWGIPIGVPKLAVVHELLFGQKRGILWHSPAVFAAAFGFVAMWGRGRTWLAILIAGTFLSLLAINAGFPTWDGGWATGPRFLLPSFPLLLLASGFWLKDGPDSRWRQRIKTALIVCWAFVAVATTVLLCGFTVAGARVPPFVETPIAGFLSPTLASRPEAMLGGAWILESVLGKPASHYPFWALALTVIAFPQGLLLWRATRRLKAE